MRSNRLNCICAGAGGQTFASLVNGRRSVCSRRPEFSGRRNSDITQRYYFRGLNGENDKS